MDGAGADRSVRLDVSGCALLAINEAAKSALLENMQPAGMPLAGS
jgi:hypothetical protein